MDDSFNARQFYGLIKKQTAKMTKDTGSPVVGMIIGVTIHEMPLRGMADMLGRARVEALLTMSNGRYLKGLLALITFGSAQP